MALTEVTSSGTGVIRSERVVETRGPIAVSEARGDEQIPPVGLREVNSLTKAGQVAICQQHDRGPDALGAKVLSVVSGFFRKPVERSEDALRGARLREVPLNPLFQSSFGRHHASRRYQGPLFAGTRLAGAAQLSGEVAQRRRALSKISDEPSGSETQMQGVR